MDLTIAICAYNAASRLPMVINALGGQRTSAAWELLVVDNNSTDETASVALRLTEGWAVPVRIVREPRQGLSHARRRAAIEARGRHLSYIDDDNVVEPDWVEQCVSFLDDHPKAGIIGGQVYPIFEDPALRPADFSEKYAEALAIRDLGANAIELRGMQLPPCGAGMTGRTALIRGILDDYQCHLVGRSGGALSSGEDTEIGLVARRLGWQTWYVPQLRMGHVLPPHRLTPEYLARLQLGFASSWPWLSTLIGKDAARSRLSHLRQVLWCVQKFLRLRLAMWRRRGEPSQLGRWAAETACIAGAHWRLALDHPARRLRAIERRADLRPEGK